jgi:hypothetical protein
VSPTAWSEYATAVVKGRQDYPPKMREIIKKYGDKTILRMFGCRTPVPSVLTSALNAVSLGEFGKRWEGQPYDKLFHLDLRIDVLEDPKSRKITTILLEKNEVLNALVNPKKSNATECVLISVFPRPMSINKMLAGAQQIQGDKFFKYSAYNNNCQDFIMALLKGVGAGTQENYDFIKQDTKELFKNLPGTRKFANTVTDIGATFNTLIEGAGAGPSVRREFSPEDIRQLMEATQQEIAAIDRKLKNMRQFSNIDRERQFIESIEIDRSQLIEKYNKLKNMLDTQNPVAGKGVKDPCWKGYEQYGMKIKKGKEVPNCVPVKAMSDLIDFEDLKWGSFTEQFNAYNRQHKRKKFKDLESFAKWLLANPQGRQQKTLRRARFYLNVLLKKK